MKILLMFSLGVALAMHAIAQVQLAVEPSKKTTKTGAVGSQSQIASYVDAVTLTITATGNAVGDLSCFFVARDPRTRAFKYHGFSVQPLKVAGKQGVRVESEPAAYTKHNSQRSTADMVTGAVPFGWVVLLKAGSTEIAAKASSAEVLKWVRENPPTKRRHSSP
jgi:hypothetical protein